MLHLSGGPEPEDYADLPAAGAGEGGGDGAWPGSRRARLRFRMVFWS